ncbi:MAG: hypothetical protein KF893_22160 [Caldilineaceae bacterium]|nr:hypothetical protein [Caldilineaceae bacterium]
MLQLFTHYSALFKSWRVVRYEQEGSSYLLQLSAILADDSRLELPDYLFTDGSRTYAYQWIESDNRLRRRWDNAPHWPTISTTPHHCHLADQVMPEPSTVTNIEELMLFLQRWFTDN